MCFTVQLSRFLSFFSRDSFYIISKLFLFVKNFFNFFLKFFISCCRFPRQLYQITTSSSACQQLFYFFFGFLHFCKSPKKKSGERGIWTLARREPSTPLAGAPLQPLEYFSNAWIISYSISSTTWAKLIILNNLPVVNHFFSFFSIIFTILFFTSSAISTDFISLYSS